MSSETAQGMSQYMTNIHTIAFSCDSTSHAIFSSWRNKPWSFDHLKWRYFSPDVKGYFGGGFSRIHKPYPYPHDFQKNVQKIWRLTWLNESILFKAALCFWEGDIYPPSERENISYLWKTEHHFVEGIRNFQVGHYPSYQFIYFWPFVGLTKTPEHNNYRGPSF